MKYNRQQKYNFYSVLKTMVLVLLLGLSFWLAYLYVVIWQKNATIVTTIESQKNQVADLEALSKANKALLRSLKGNIENQKQNLKRLQNEMGRYNGKVESEQALLAVKQVQIELQERLENLSRIANDVQLERGDKSNDDKRKREDTIEELQRKVNELRDSVEILKDKENRKVVNNDEQIGKGSETRIINNVNQKPEIGTDKNN